MDGWKSRRMARKRQQRRNTVPCPPAASRLTDDEKFAKPDSKLENKKTPVKITGVVIVCHLVAARFQRAENSAQSHT